MIFCYVKDFVQGGVELQASISIRATDYFKQRPSFSADNPDDFYGYTDIEWEVANVDVFLEETGELLYSESVQDLEKYGLQDEDVHDWLLTQVEEGQWWDEEDYD